jgi:predicted ester cyclase
MEQQKQNKEFIIQYYNALSGVTKTRELLEQYITDEELIGHGIFFDSVFPKYEAFVDEMIAEGNKVVVRGRMKGRHEGEFMRILPTHRSIEHPAVVCYEIENGKIVHHWIMSDSISLMEQLGVTNVPA